MDTGILVRDHIEIGRRLFAKARLQGLEIIAAYWFNDDERNYWRLILISPDVPTKGPAWAYDRLEAALFDLQREAASETGGKEIDLAIVAEVYEAASVLSPATRLFVDMQRSLANADRSEIRESNFRGAYVYELTAAQPVGS